MNEIISFSNNQVELLMIRGEVTKAAFFQQKIEPLDDMFIKKIYAPCDYSTDALTRPSTKEVLRGATPSSRFSNRRISKNS